MREPSIQYDLFLSHHSGDKPWVILLKAALREKGVSVWLDRDEILPGDLFIDALARGLDASRALALIVSPRSLKSNWVKREYQRALNAEAHGKSVRIIPCILETATLPPFVAELEWVDFRDPSRFEHGVEQLCRAVAFQRTAAAGGPSPATAEPHADPLAPSITREDLEFLQRRIPRLRRELLNVIVQWSAAAGVGVTAAASWPREVGQLNPAIVLGAGLVPGLIAFGLTSTKWRKCLDELRGVRVRCELLSSCLAAPRPICRDIIDSYHRYLKLLLDVRSQQPGTTS